MSDLLSLGEFEFGDIDDRDDRAVRADVLLTRLVMVEHRGSKGYGLWVMRV